MIITKLYCKGHNSETAKWKRSIEQGEGGELQPCGTLSTMEVFINWKLPKPSVNAFNMASQYTSMIKSLAK